MEPSAELARRIVDTAIELAEARSWESIRLHEVAAAAGIALDDIRRHFREKDELIDAWFDRADAAMLALAATEALLPLSARDRLSRLIMAWLAALEGHRRVTRQMIQAKAELGHIHIQIPALMRISRTVQWLREAALLRDSDWRRAVAETLLTSIYLAVFLRWLRDTEAGSPRTRRFLDTLLAAAEKLALTLPGFAAMAATRDDKPFAE